MLLWNFRSTIPAMLLWNSVSRVETLCGFQTHMARCLTSNSILSGGFDLRKPRFHCTRVPRSQNSLIHVPQANRRRTISFQSFDSYGIKTTDPNIPSSKYEILLAELAFSNPLEFPKIVESNLEILDEPFYECTHLLFVLVGAASDIVLCLAVLDARIRSAQDPREEGILRLIREAVTDLMTSVLNHAVKVHGACSSLHLLPSPHLHRLGLGRCTSAKIT